MLSVHCLFYGSIIPVILSRNLWHRTDTWLLWGIWLWCQLCVHSVNTEKSPFASDTFIASVYTNPCLGFGIINSKAHNTSIGFNNSFLMFFQHVTPLNKYPEGKALINWTYWLPPLVSASCWNERNSTVSHFSPQRNWSSSLTEHRFRLLPGARLCGRQWV